MRAKQIENIITSEQQAIMRVINSIIEDPENRDRYMAYAPKMIESSLKLVANETIRSIKNDIQNI